MAWEPHSYDGIIELCPLCQSRCSMVHKYPRAGSYNKTRYAVACTRCGYSYSDTHTVPQGEHQVFAAHNRAARTLKEVK